MGDEGPRWRVLNHTSGADFESGAAHRARGVNEEQPRGEPPAAYDDSVFVTVYTVLSFGSLVCTDVLYTTPWYMYGVRTVHPP